MVGWQVSPVVRKTVRTNLQAALKAAVLPGTTTLCFKSTWEGVPTEVLNEEMPACIIKIGDSRETRATAPVGGGLKLLSFDVRLDVFAWLDSVDDLLGSRLLDDILDGVDLTLRANSTDSGAVALMYDDITTLVHDPIVSSDGEGSPGMVLLHATRTFKALGFDIG